MISAFENRTSAFELPSSPDDGCKFTELYNVQHLQSTQLDRVSRVCISTIQRLYSMLRPFVIGDRNIDAARRDQREETGSALCAFNEARAIRLPNELDCAVVPS